LTLHEGLTMFLLDTSAVSDLVNPSRPLHAKVVAFTNQHAGVEHHLFICVISLAEMQFGLDLYTGHASRPNQASLDAVHRRIKAASRISEPLAVTHHVALEQGRLRANSNSISIVQ
jgi:predicted nucleic acid-binding protein